MKFKIGFADRKEEKEPELTAAPILTEPRKSVVRVYFEARGFACSYYNDMFDLHEGDTVFVDGKLEGLRGRVVDVTYNFKIKLSDYKRVIAKADTEVHGKFYASQSGFVTFDKSAIPSAKAKTWFIAPSDSEYESGDGEPQMLSLDDFEEKVPFSVVSAGTGICENGDVVYLSIESGNGYAIIKDGKIYREVEFLFESGKIGGFTCDCYSTGICAHCAAAAIKLRAVFKELGKDYPDEYRYGDGFSCTLVNDVRPRK